MRFSDEERRFLAKRGRLVKTWPYVGGGLLAMLVASAAWTVRNRPLIANPVAVRERLESGDLADSTVSTMAALLPAVVLLCFSLAVVMVLFAFYSFSNERRYLALIRRASEEADVAGRPKPPGARASRGEG